MPQTPSDARLASEALGGSKAAFDLGAVVTHVFASDAEADEAGASRYVHALDGDIDQWLADPDTLRRVLSSE
jgi:hypothetical protein